MSATLIKLNCPPKCMFVAQVPCPGGFYCQTAGLDSATGECDSGYFCLSQSSSATPDGADATGRSSHYGTLLLNSYFYSKLMQSDIVVLNWCMFLCRLSTNLRQKWLCTTQVVPVNSLGRYRLNKTADTSTILLVNSKFPAESILLSRTI